MTSEYSFKDEKLFFNLLIEKFGIKKNETLDIGCGSGFFTNLLNDIGFNACGLDFDMDKIKSACKKYSADFLLGDARNPPFHPETYDFILSRGLSTFYPDITAKTSDQREVLLNLLKTDGILVFITASNLSGKKTRIQNHEIKDVLDFFSKKETEAKVYFFFAKNHLFKVFRLLAFGSIFTKLSSMFTKISGRSGYIVCIITKKS